MGFALNVSGKALIQNGTIQNEYGVTVRGGEVRFENVKIEATKRALECINDSVVTIDENCEFVTTGGDCTVFISGEGETTPVLNVYGKLSNTFAGGHYAISGNGNDKTNCITNIYTGAEIKSLADSAIYQPNGGTTNVYGGLVEGLNGIYQKSGVVNVIGGEIVGKGNAEYSYYGNGSNPIGDAITVEFCAYPAGDPVLNVNNGKFVSDNKQAINAYKPIEKKNGSASLDIKNEELKALVDKCINIKAGEFNPELAEAFKK